MPRRSGTSPKIRKQNDCLIRTIREAMGITTDELAELADLKYNIVYRAENGKAIRQGAIEKIANALNVLPDIISYSTGQVPREKLELMKKDPLFFKELIDKASEDPEKLTKTKDYMENIKGKMKPTNPDVNKLLSKIKPT